MNTHATPLLVTAECERAVSTQQHAFTSSRVSSSSRVRLGERLQTLRWATVLWKFVVQVCEKDDFVA